jgi:membrane associated rhomboid family serine protease
MKLHYNAPVILTFALVSAVAMLISIVTGGLSTQMFFITYPGSFLSPFTYLRLFTHIIGHSGWDHLFSNFSFILLIGPLLEEKYGSRTMLTMILITALATGLLNNLFMGTGLYGASGIVFMLILLSSFANLRSGHIPLTFVIIVIMYLGREVFNSLRPDNISQFAHIAGGICGGIFGFLQIKDDKKPL